MSEEMNNTTLRWYQKSIFRYIFLSLFALVTTSLITLSQADSSLRSHLKKIDLDSIKSESEQIRASLTNELLYLRSIGRFVSNLSANQDHERISNTLQAMVNSSQSLVAIQIIYADSNKNIIKVSERRFVEMNNASFVPLRTPISLLGERLIERTISKNKTLLRLESASIQDNIPVMMVGGHFDVIESGPWVVMHVIESHFQRLFRKNSQFASALITSAGKTIVSAPDTQGSSLLMPTDETELAQLEAEKIQSATFKEKALNGIPLFENTLPIELTDAYLITQSLRIGERNFIQNLYTKTFAINLMLVIAFTFLIYFVMLLLSNRIRRLASAVLSLGDESFNFNPPKKIRDEISQLEFAFSTSAQRIGEAVANIKQETQKKYEVKIYEDKLHPICPKNSLVERGISTFAYFKPAAECPGDWWGRFPCGKNREILVIADALGHDGISSTAAILTYTFFKTLHSVVETSGEHEISPTKLIQDLNTILYTSLNGKAEIKVFLMLFDLENMVSTAASGGHCHPFLIDERFTGTVNCNGEALGKKPRTDVDEVSIKLQTGQRFVFHTDGLFQCRNSSNATLDRNEFFQQLGEHRRESVNKYSEFFFSKLKLHFQDEPLEDDLTMVILEVHEAIMTETPAKGLQETKTDFPKIEW